MMEKKCLIGFVAAADEVGELVSSHVIPNSAKDVIKAFLV